MPVDDNVVTGHTELVPDSAALRAQVREKYRQVATDREGSYHFHIGRGLAARLGYDEELSTGCRNPRGVLRRDR
jgi:hypothetical protein